MNTSKRSIHIETLRGLACLLLVFYHVVGPIDGGLKLGEGSAYRLVTDALVDVRMPLFTFISGFIYSLHAARRKPLPAFLLGKVRRLLVPLVFVGIPISLAQALGPGVNKDVSVADAFLSVLWPINHFWFLQAIFVIFCVVAVLESRELMKGPHRFAIVCLAVAALFLAPIPGTHFFSMDGAIYLAPFFLTGMAVQRYFPTLGATGRILACLGVVALFALQIYIAAHQRELAIDRRGALALTVGVAACLLLYGCGFKSRLLTFVGNYSFAIYLFHTVFTVATRTVLGRLGVADVNAFVLLELAAGLTCPIALAVLLSRNPLLASLFLGEPRKRAMPSAANGNMPARE